MDMLNLDVYNLSMKQNFMALLNQFESEGITDIRFVRQRVQRHIDTASNIPTAVKRVRVRVTPSVVVRCPDPKCNAILIPVNTGGEDIKILACPSCRFSKVIK